MAFAVRRRERPGAGLHRCVLELLESVTKLLAHPTAGIPAKVVHRVRQQLKKARAVLRLLRRDGEAALLAKASKALREAGRALSRARDARVALATLVALMRRGSLRTPEILRFRHRLERAAFGHESDRQPAGVAIRWIRSGREAVRGAGVADYGRKDLRRAMARVYRRARNTWREHAREGDVESLHECRKRTKDLLYALRVLRKRCTPEGRSSTRAFRRLAELQGLRLDLETLSRLAAQAGGAAPASLAGPKEDEALRLDRRVERLSRLQFDSTPREFLKSVFRR